MAQTKAKPKSKAQPKSRSKAKSTPRSKARSSAKAKSGTNSKPKSKARSNSKANAKSSPSRNGSRGAHTLQDAASKAKIPLMVAGGAVIGGAAGAAAVGSRSGQKVLGVKMPQPKRVKIRSKDLRKAAKQVGSFGEQVGELTGELRRVRKGMSKA